MRNVISILAVLLLLSCGKRLNSNSPEEIAAAETFPNNNPDAATKIKLKSLFETWKKNMIATGEFWPKDSCLPQIAMLPKYDDLPNPIWGFPDESEFVFSYGDLNGDGIIDQMVTFQPSQCDGGNGSMWIQTQVFNLSGNGTYTTDSNHGELFPLPDRNDTGIFFYDSIAANKIYGTYYKFLEKDGHCCPSIEKLAVLDYREKRWTFKEKSKKE